MQSKNSSIEGPAPVSSTNINLSPAESIPVVIYEQGLLTILGNKSTLGDVLREISNQTGAQIDIPPGADEAVAPQFGPGPPREVMDALLNGSPFNYAIVASSDQSALLRVVLLPRPPSTKASGPPINVARNIAIPSSPEAIEGVQPADDPMPIRAQQRMLQEHRQAVMRSFQQNQQTH